MRAQSQHDLSVPQFRTLAYLSHHPGSSLSAVAEFIGLTLPSMSILVDGLVERALVQRLTDTRDRRRMTLTLTEAGGQLYDRALQGAEARFAALLAPLAETERVAILHALEALRPIFTPMTTPTGVVQE